VLFPKKKSAQPCRVVITGAGIVTALGTGWRVNADGFRAGRTAFRPVTLFDVSRQRTKIAAEVDLPEKFPGTQLTPNHFRRLGRGSKMLLLAAHEALAQAAWPVPGREIPIVLGTTSGEMALGEIFLRQALASPHTGKKQASRIVHYQVQQQGLDLCDAFGIHGAVTTISNACASGANAIGHAFELLRIGSAEKVLTGGYDALCHLTFAGFDSLQALSPTPCRPFDAQRDGLSLGEGAAVLTLETLEHATQRGAEILAEIIGYGAATDTHHLTQPHPEGNAALAAMNAACALAGLTPPQIDYVNAHGTATPQNDATEAAAINRWAGADAEKICVSSTKAGVGHLLGAAGAVEAVACLMALREQFLPPEISVQNVDPAVRFQIVRRPTDRPVETALSNSFGFGGANASLIFRRWK
jgi:3-oxoacyl-[acyl-carrier-protein] synthase II